MKIKLKVGLLAIGLSFCLLFYVAIFSKSGGDIGYKQIPIQYTDDRVMLKPSFTTVKAKAGPTDLLTVSKIQQLYQETDDILKKLKIKFKDQIYKLLQTNAEYPSRRINQTLYPKCHRHYDLVVLVTSSPHNIYERESIRSGWGRPDSKINMILNNGVIASYKTIFSLGRSQNQKINHLVDSESRIYEDILQLNFIDSYNNLTRKTVSSIEWVAYNCPTNYVIKTDDDCYLNILRVMPWLRRLPKNVKYVGRKQEDMDVIRDPTHRNYVSKKDHPSDTYQSYCSGGGYLLSGKVLKRIAASSKRIPYIINEDAYMGMVAHSVRVSPYNDGRFLPFIYEQIPVIQKNPCAWRSKYLMHGIIGSEQIVMHFNSILMEKFPFMCALYLDSKGIDNSMDIPV